MLKDGSRITLEEYPGLHRELVTRLCQLRESWEESDELKTVYNVSMKSNLFVHTYEDYIFRMDTSFVDETGVSFLKREGVSVETFYLLRKLSDIIFLVEDITKLFMWRMNGVKSDIDLGYPLKSKFLCSRLFRYLISMAGDMHGEKFKKAVGIQMREMIDDTSTEFLEKTGAIFPPPFNYNVFVKDIDKFLLWRVNGTSDIY